MMAGEELLAGDLLHLSCPSPSKPLLKVGDRLPAEKPLFVVARIEESQIWLGPLQAGPVEAELKCDNGQTLKAQALVTAQLPNGLPQHAPPAGPFNLEYPVWFWWALALACALVALTSLFAWLWQRRRQAAARALKEASKKSPRQKKLGAEEAFARYLLEADKGAWCDTSDETLALRLYSEGQERLRGLLEMKLGFRASWATTSEFVAQLNTVLLAAGPLRAVGAEVESLLNQADLVRFAKSIPESGARRQFLKQMGEIFRRFPKTTGGAA